MIFITSAFQGALEQGKQIPDGTLIDNECIDLRAREPRVACKIDLVKILLLCGLELSHLYAIEIWFQS